MSDENVPREKKREEGGVPTWVIVAGVVLVGALAFAFLRGGPSMGSIPAPPDVAAAPDDAEQTSSGLASRVLREGTGTRHPTASSTVEVHYTGWTTDGEMFDSSRTRGESIEFPLNGVIAGWTEGLQLMVEGEERRLWIPEDLAYGGRAGAPAGMLVFDVELIRIVD